MSTSVQKASLSERLGHLELLLNELRSASEALVATLHAEAEFGEKALAAEPRDSIALWREHRNEVERAQSMYCQAVREYRHFVNERPESLRATAVRRGEQANALAARELALLPK